MEVHSGVGCVSFVFLKCFFFLGGVVFVLLDFSSFYISFWYFFAVFIQRGEPGNEITAVALQPFSKATASSACSLTSNRTYLVERGVSRILRPGLYHPRYAMIYRRDQSIVLGRGFYLRLINRSGSRHRGAAAINGSVFYER